MLPSQPSRRAERGAVVLVIAVLAVVLLGFIGLAIDTGHVSTAASQLQAAADAAALAGAQQLSWEASSNGSFPLTRQAAVSCGGANEAAGMAVVLQANAANAPDGDVVVGTWDATSSSFVPNTSSPNAVKVTARRTQASSGGPLGLLFGGLFGVSSSDVARSAIATWDAVENSMVHVNHPSAAGALSMNGTTLLDVGGGKVMVNSCDPSAIKLVGSAELVAASVATNGGADAPAGAIQGTLEEWVPTQPDPLAHILPDTYSFTSLRSSLPKPKGGSGSITASGTYSPGYYPKGINIKSSTVVTLNPGTYVFASTAKLAGSARLQGEGVTLLFDAGVNLSVSGSASMVLTPPASGDFEGLALMFHRNNTSSKACSLGGGGTFDIEGSVYVPAGTLELHGTSQFQDFGQLVCDKLSVRGTSEITGLNVVPPNNGGSVYLVH